MSRGRHEVFELGDLALEGGATLRGARRAYATFRTLSGHVAGGGADPTDTAFIDRALAELLAE